MATIAFFVKIIRNQNHNQAQVQDKQATKLRLCRVHGFGDGKENIFFWLVDKGSSKEKKTALGMN